MTGRLFRNSMMVGISVFLLSVALFMGVLYQYFGARITDELKNESLLVARGVDAMGMNYLEGLDTSCRITWVADDGVVLYDNVADYAAMENHADREEIQEALGEVQGVAQRNSSTLSQKTFYVARRLEDGSVIRLASTQDTVVLLLISMLQPLLVILIAAVVLSGILANRLSRRIMQPILELDLEHPESCNTYDELAPLLTRIRKQNETIKQQIELLRQRQQEFETLTENMSEGFLLLDRGGRVLSYNSGAVRLLGAAQPIEHAHVMTLNRSEAFQRAVEQVLDGKRSQGRLERDGRCIQLLADPVHREAQVAGAVLVLLDVTEREQGEQMRREFTANVSHELKTPLTAISGMAEIMKGGLVRAEDMPGFAEDIYKESQRLIALVEDIIHLSRLDEGNSALEQEEVNLFEVAQTVLCRLESMAAKGQVALSLSGTGGVVQGIPYLLDEMVYNLCENAIKYNRPQGRVDLQVNREENTVLLRVQDTGIGIPDQDQERVFERFYRVDKSHSKEIGGTGLGLSIVKHGALLHHAELKLTSEVGKGTTVELRFPAC